MGITCPGQVYSTSLLSDQEDVFKIECRNVGEVQKLRIGHDGKGAQSGWHLATVVLYQATEKPNPKNVGHFYRYLRDLYNWVNT